MKKEDVYQVKDDIFIETIKNSKSIHEALTKMKLNARGAAYKTFRLRCKKLRVDLSHFSSDKKQRSEISDETIRFAVSTHTSRQSLLKAFSLDPHSGTNVRWINEKIQSLNLNCDHWTKQAHLKNKTHDWSDKKPLEEILVENSDYQSTASLKKRLLKENLLEYKCYNPKCGITEWLGEAITLQLEHKNGNNKDNRIENLCLLCPNCHSQTETFAGRNIGGHGGTRTHTP